MRGTGATQLQAASTASSSQRWRALIWKIILAALLFFLLSVGVPGQFLPSFVQSTLVLWGALFVALAGSSLFRDTTSIQWAWCSLTIGAYAALTIPIVFTGDPTKTINALGPVVVLTLVAHLGRHDLQRALRDWAVVVGLALYTALGIGAAWIVMASFGWVVFSVAALLPPLVLEVALLLARRLAGLSELQRYVFALVPATLVAIGIISSTQLNPNMDLTTSIIFDAIIGVLIGGALLVSLLTRPMTEAASGEAGQSGMNVSRALLEFTHSALLIALAIYIPVKLFIR